MIGIQTSPNGSQFKLIMLVKYDLGSYTQMKNKSNCKDQIETKLSYTTNTRNLLYNK